MAGASPATGGDGSRSATRPSRWLQFRRRLRNRAAEMDRLYLPAARLLRPDHAPGPGTDLVVEGFPRSANSWIEGCVRAAWPELSVAQHLHAAASLRFAARRGLPAMLLLRPPDAAVASLMLRDPRIYDPALAFAEYARFHAGLTGIADRLLVVPFEAATGPFPRIARALVARFGLDWPVPDWDAARDRAAWAEVDRLTRARVGRAHVSYSPATDPDAAAARAERARAGIEALTRAALSPGAARDRSRARALHAALLARAPAALRRPGQAPRPAGRDQPTSSRSSTTP